MRDFLTELEHTFRWVPDWVVGLGLITGAIAVALIVHSIAQRLVHRMVRSQNSVAPQLLERTSGPSRLALCLAAVALVLPLAPLDDLLRLTLGHVFGVAVIALVGWISIRAVDMASARYLDKFRLDVAENFLARKHVTQVRVFKRVTDTLIVIIAVSTALMTFDSVRQYGVSLFASAGAAGLIVGLAARPLLSNLIAGVQIAVTQPIRIEDAVIIENEWGWVEDIASTYVVIRLWDWRRMVVPLSYFIERPFQNWTRDAQSLIGAIALHVDYSADVPGIRKKLEQVAKESRLWDGAVVNLQVIDTHPRTIELRALVSARNAPQSWDLRCEIREKLLAFIRDEMPEALPRDRAILAPAADGFGRGFLHGAPPRERSAATSPN
ncbi:mechanosensitive ion channel family protein [Bradyrhizobium sp. NAS96.2]|uniref:mechanosensitive ion channel family protein n=1 Tax=Bradyrhizobium sp. NAS96.2 TaxID=1680160 RepID=UPI00093DE441|nr:mechanosensitive ion channel family protein [Bradyrhizobium sp. NAS96.2]OKO81378.1 mechanosensitive ion channel protein MscS [Bradyrhizobium sp. NAS96.2]